MSELQKPSQRPQNPRFSCGPCTKRPGWTLQALEHAALGRSHRSQGSKAKLQSAIMQTRDILRLPEGYQLAIMPGSDTGAMEAALWSLLGERGVDVLAWDIFGKVWVTDIISALKLKGARSFDPAPGQLPDLTQVDFSRDVVFTWNGTTSGIRVPNADWIAADREGLTICDATSAAFAQPLDWQKLDVTTFSWQKVMGGEAQHGMIILSPRAIQRLQTYSPPWPIPKIFRLAENRKLNQGLFVGDTLNTPSMMCIEDYLDALSWAKSIGGVEALIARANDNASIIHQWMERTPWIDHVATVPETRSNTSICMKFSDPAIVDLPEEKQWDFISKMLLLLEGENAAYDIAAHRLASPGLRIWTGATVEKSDLEALTPWLDWVYATARSNLIQTA